MEKVIESWSIGLSGFTVSRDGDGDLAVEVQERGSGQPREDAPPPRAEVRIPVDTWRAIVALVERKLAANGAQR